LEGKLATSKPPEPAFARVDVARAQAVVSAPRLAEPLPAIEPTEHSSGVIEIELRSGTRIRVDGEVNGKALKHVLDALRDR
jgi:hypothetical protein